MKPRWLFFVLVAYVAIEIIVAVYAVPRLVHTTTVLLTPTEYAEPTFVPKISPLPCSRYVHPDPLQCVKGK